jgi:hypothetical protein
MIDRSVSDGIFRHQLEGFPRYPRNADSRFLEVFNEQCLSVAHARAVANSFREKMPSLQDIIDVAVNLRVQFELKEPERVRWEREYGPPKPNWSINLVGKPHEQQKRRMLWEAIRDSVYYTEGPGRASIERISNPDKRKADRDFWTGQALRMRANHSAELEAFRRDDLSRGWDDLMKEDWANEVPEAVTLQEFKRITQADINRVKAQRMLAAGEREPGEGE